MKKLILFGVGETADTQYEYFKEYSDFEVVGFTVDKKFIVNSTINNLPVYNFEQIQNFININEHYIHICISYTNLNKLRQKYFLESLNKGFKLASFISPQAFVSKTAIIGDGVFIYDHVSINHNCRIGNNSTICSGTVISHSTTIGNNVFIAPNTSIGGFSKIGNNSFIGIGTTIVDKISITENVIVSAGSVVTKDAANSNIYKGNPAIDCKLSSEQFLLLNGDM